MSLLVIGWCVFLERVKNTPTDRCPIVKDLADEHYRREVRPCRIELRNELACLFFPTKFIEGNRGEYQ